MLFINAAIHYGVGLGFAWPDMFNLATAMALIENEPQAVSKIVLFNFANQGTM